MQLPTPVDPFSVSTFPEPAAFPADQVDLTLSVARATPILPGDVHLWQCTTAISFTAMNRLQNLLTPAESQRADAFGHPGDRQRFIVARAGLRAILGNHFGIPPHAVQLELTRFGRPVLVSDASDAPLSFSVSHASEMVAIVIGAGIEVGVDVENPFVERPLARLAARIYGPEERAHLDGAGELFGPDFYRIWTLREAYLKAIGTGLAGWSGRDITLGGSGPISTENPDRRWLSHRIDHGAVAISAAPERYFSWKV